MSLRDSHLLVFANKQDLPNAMSVSQMQDELGLNRLHNRKVSTLSILLTKELSYDILSPLPIVLSKHFIHPHPHIEIATTISDTLAIRKWFYASHFISTVFQIKVSASGQGAACL